MLICAARSGAREKLPVLPADSGGALTVIYSNPVRNKVLFPRVQGGTTPAKQATTKRDLLRLSQPAENRNCSGGRRKGMQWVSSSNRKVLLGFGSVMYFVVRRERSAAVQQVSPPVQEHSETAASVIAFAPKKAPGGG
jgi:hypothetical protein